MLRERSIPVAGNPSPSSSHGGTKSKNLSSPLFFFPHLNPTSILEPERSPFSKRQPETPPLELRSEPIGLAILDVLINDKESAWVPIGLVTVEGPIHGVATLLPIEFGVKNKESLLALVSPGRPLLPAVFDGVSASATELETLENYSCVISRGSNPKTTHIIDDCCVLELGRLSNYCTKSSTRCVSGSKE